MSAEARIHLEHASRQQRLDWPSAGQAKKIGENRNDAQLARQRGVVLIAAHHARNHV